jgi:hypothetical protein
MMANLLDVDDFSQVWSVTRGLLLILVGYQLSQAIL